MAETGRVRSNAIGCLVLVALSMFIGGFQGLYTLIRNFRPTKMDCADYLRERPGKEWLRLENCSLNFLESAYNKRMTSRTSFSFGEVYIPARSPHSSGDEPVVLVIASHERRHMDVVVDLIELGDDEAKVLTYAVENRDKLMIQEDVQGLVRFGIELDSDEMNELRSLVENLDQDFVLLDLGKAPKRAFTLFALSLGTLAMALAFFLARRA